MGILHDQSLSGAFAPGSHRQTLLYTMSSPSDLLTSRLCEETDRHELSAEKLSAWNRTVDGMANSGMCSTRNHCWSAPW